MSSRSFDGAHDGALHEFDLEVVVAPALRVLCSERRCATKLNGAEAGASQRCFDPGDAPRLGSDPAALRPAAALAAQGAEGRGHNDFKIELMQRAIVRAVEIAGARP